MTQDDCEDGGPRCPSWGPKQISRRQADQSVILPDCSETPADLLTMLWLEFAPGLSTATMLARFLEREKR